MPDFSDIPDEAVEAAHDISWGGEQANRRHIRMMLAAARPVLDTARDAETAEPELVMGTKPDGSPWVVSAEFARSDVRVDGYGALRLHGKAISPRTAHELATGLLAAIAWLENDGAAKAEAAASLRGEQSA